jgi:hypothetical protein
MMMMMVIVEVMMVLRWKEQATTVAYAVPQDGILSMACEIDLYG